MTDVKFSLFTSEGTESGQDVRMGFFLPAAQRDKFAAFCKEKGLSQSEVLRRAVAAVIEQAEAEAGEAKGGKK